MERRKGSIDMLSGLPDEVLHHILSFLTTKTSVCTCVLSKRWRFLWKHVHNLEFDGNHFRGKKTTQINIINRVIMLHEAKILNTFSCRLADAKGCAYQLETLIIYPITLGVRNLYLDFGFNYEDDIVCTFPRLLLTCKTLVDLRLVNCGVIPSTAELFLPSLKKLNLSYVDYESDESLPHLLSGCPVLEELIVHDCSRSKQKNSGCVIVTSLTLKRLNVEFSNGDSQHLEEMLIIDVPALVNLKVGHCDLDSIKSLRKTMTSLDKAEIDICVDSHMCDIDCYEHDSSIEFLSCLCNVRYLKITSDLGPLVGIVGTGSMPMLVNLTKLQLNVAVNWYNVVKFLEIADNLEVLIIYAHKTIPCDEPVPYNEPKRVPTCMLSCLRTVRLYNVCEDTFDMVRYILRNAQVLDMMEISYLDSDKEKFDTLQRILFFERASKSCQVVFSIDKIVRDVINMLS